MLFLNLEASVTKRGQLKIIITGILEISSGCLLWFCGRKIAETRKGGSAND